MLIAPHLNRSKTFCKNIHFRSRCCPIDRTPVTNTSRPTHEQPQQQSREVTRSATVRAPLSGGTGDNHELLVPGIGLVCTAMSPMKRYDPEAMQRAKKWVVLFASLIIWNVLFLMTDRRTD